MILVAGANPHMRPLQHHTWESFSANWESDVRITFHWLREILLTPLRPGARVVVVSSGAALVGSPLSGGYAGAKATQRFITGYAQDEAQRAGLDITFSTVLPRMTPVTELGRSAARAYAARNGQSQEEYLQQMGPVLTPEIMRQRDGGPGAFAGHRGRPRVPADRRRPEEARLSLRRTASSVVRT